MKKVIIALVAVAFAAVANAAAFDWKTSATGKVYSQGSDTLLSSGTAYLFDSATVSQSAVYTAVMEGGSLSSLSSIGSKSISAGAIAASASPIEWGAAGDTLTAFFAVVDTDGNLYISATASGDAQATSTTTISFNAKATSQGAASTGAYSGAGWYSSGSVPEPTTGLLVLLGMAGLALKRKVA